MNLTKSFFSTKLWITVILILTSILTTAQTRGLSLEKIMAGNEFIGHQPTNITWSPDGNSIYFRWNKDNEYVAPYYAYDLTNKNYKKINVDEAKSLALEGYTDSEKDESKYFRRGNQLYRFYEGQTEMVYEDFGGYRLSKAIDKNTFIIERKDNLYLHQSAPFQIKQLTNFVGGKERAEKNDQNFLENQQRELFEIVRLNDSRDSAKKVFRETHVNQARNPFYKNDRNIEILEISNSLRYCVFRATKYPENKQTHIESYLTENGQSKSKNARAKVGKDDPTHELFVWDLQKDTTYKIDFFGLSDIYARPEYQMEYNKELTDRLEEPKNIIMHGHGFNDSESRFLVEVKSYDNKHRWITWVELESMSIKEIDQQHDPAWIGGPGISGWNMVGGNVGWINDHSCYFQTEEATGYSQLYVADDGPKANYWIGRITSGQWEVYETTVSNDKTKMFITGNKTHAGNRDFYICDIKSEKLTPILTGDGNHEVHISPDEKWLAIRYSYKNKPWELYIAPLKKDAEMTQITDSQTKEFKSYNWRDVEVITFKATDGADVPARIYRPTTDKKNGAAVIFVHGAGYLQNAHNWWSGYYREYMFNNLLCDLGYTVLDIDYRASKGYGRDWRTAIYQHMGGADLSDQMDGRQFLIEEEGIDENRIGMYGGSYGGFITLMALLTEPGKFKCGAALRSVTDWAHYNHEYTSNILNTPEEDPDAFKRSSPIYFAENLEDKLVMLHGIEDDNVQYQDVVRLSQRFIELGKKDWDLVGFPIEPHGFKETSSWIEEYRRILELFESELK